MNVSLPLTVNFDVMFFMLFESLNQVGSLRQLKIKTFVLIRYYGRF